MLLDLAARDTAQQLLIKCATWRCIPGPPSELIAVAKELLQVSQAARTLPAALVAGMFVVLVEQPATQLCAPCAELSVVEGHRLMATSLPCDR